MRVILPRSPRVRPGFVLVFAAVLLVALPRREYAHDIPATVSLLAFVKPEGRVLRVVLRVPLEAMRDVNFPLAGPGYLDLHRVRPLLGDATKVWIADELHFAENGAALGAPRIVATRVSLPSEHVFTSYDLAMTHTIGPPLPNGTQIMWKQAMLDVVLEYPIGSERSRFSVRPTLARLGIRTTTVLRFLPPGRAERDFEYVGNPGLVRLDPSWIQAAGSFVLLGFEHILSGIDHLLFLLCLVIPFRRIKPLLAIVTAFTVAHSITLIASASGLAPDALWFPPLIEMLIALSIVYMALENIVGANIQRRWIVAFGFGLVHGFGFSFALRQSLQFAGAHLATSLLSFNLGVELGQIAVLAVAIPALNVLFSRVLAERMGTIIVSAFVAHTAWHWLVDRGTVLMQYHVELPTVDAAFLASVTRGLMLCVAVLGVGSLVVWLGRRPRSAPSLELENTPSVPNE